MAQQQQPEAVPSLADLQSMAERYGEQGMRMATGKNLGDILGKLVAKIGELDRRIAKLEKGARVT